MLCCFSDLGDSNADKTLLKSTKRFDRKHATGSGMIEVHEVVVERGMSFEEAKQKARDLSGPHDGFYLAKEVPDYVKSKTSLN